jgi:hypothetical protein
MANAKLSDLNEKTTLSDTDIFLITDSDDSTSKRISKSNLDGNIEIAASQVSDFDTEVANNTAVTANTAKISFDSTSSTKLGTIEEGAEVNNIVTGMTGQTTVTAANDDYVLISDTSDSGNLKKSLISDIQGGGADSTGILGSVNVADGSSGLSQSSVYFVSTETEFRAALYDDTYFIKTIFITGDVVMNNDKYYVSGVNYVSSPSHQYVTLNNAMSFESRLGYGTSSFIYLDAAGIDNESNNVIDTSGGFKLYISMIYGNTGAVLEKAESSGYIFVSTMREWNKITLVGDIDRFYENSSYTHPEMYDGTVDPSVAPGSIGATWINKTDGNVFVSTGVGTVADWKQLNSNIIDVVDDTTPQLGGDLDVNGNAIVSVSDGNIAITPDGTGITYVGNGDDSALNANTGFMLTSDNDDRTMIINTAHYASDSLSPEFRSYKSRGTLAAPTTLLDGDIVGAIQFFGRSDSFYSSAGSITSKVNGTPSSTRVPSDLIFKLGGASTSDNKFSFTDRFNAEVAYIDGDGYASFKDIPNITSGTSAPSSTPGKVGDIYVNTSAKKLYFATGATASTDWTIAN